MLRTAARVSGQSHDVRRAVDVASPAEQLLSRSDRVLAHQRSAGNKAVNRLARRASPTLRVGPSGDASEREAERIATAVTGVAHDRTSADIQRAPDSDAVGLAGGPVSGDLAARIGAASGGSPLPDDLRSTMEANIGADFRGVRVHTNDEAARLNRRLGARAFTHGANIFMGAGRHDPASASGRRLLAHELTHVVQQRAAPRLGDPGQGPGVHAPAHTVARCVQRSVGFEFETKGLHTQQGNVELSPAAFLTEEDGVNAYGAGTMRRIPKGGGILERADIRVEADDDALRSDLEVVTTHFPETPQGRARLEAAMTALADLFQRGIALSDDIAYVKAASLAGHGFDVVNLRAMIEGSWRAATTAPQVTFGVRLRNVGNVVADLQGRDPENPHQANQRARGRLMMRRPNANHPDRPRDLSVLDEASTLIRGATMARSTLAAYRGDKADAPGGPAMEGFLTILFSYTEGMQRKRSFLKDHTPLMAKTDLATTWSTLPRDVRDYWGASVWGTIRLEKLIASAPGYGPRLDRPFFDVSADDIATFDESVDFAAKQWFHKLSLRKLLRGITKGRDYLTTREFPNIPDNQRIEGYGVLGDRMDVRGDEALPVFELRSASRALRYDQAVPWALMMFDYIVSLNDNPNGGHRVISDDLPPSGY